MPFMLAENIDATICPAPGHRSPSLRLMSTAQCRWQLANFSGGLIPAVQRAALRSLRAAVDLPLSDGLRQERLLPAGHACLIR